MVFVKVRETYDLKTVKNKMTIIGIHTPKSNIIKANFPGLLMQCKAYRPVSCDVRIACASMLPVDPLGVGQSEGDIAPEDLFNPILYKAITNVGMSQIEAAITYLNVNQSGSNEVNGPSAGVDVNSVTTDNDEFDTYYGLLANSHGWKHANPQQGLQMTGLKPLVFEMLYNVGDNNAIEGTSYNATGYPAPNNAGNRVMPNAVGFRGNAKPMPFINCTAYSVTNAAQGTGVAEAGFKGTGMPINAETDVPAPCVVCGCIIVPPSRLHELFYRMVVEWTLEFTGIRPLGEITNWAGLRTIAGVTHYKNYDYSNTSKALGVEKTNLSSDTDCVSANVEIEKVM